MPPALWQDDFNDFSDEERDEIPEGGCVACTTFLRPDGVWMLHYMGFQISLPGNGPWWVEQTPDGLWMVTNGTKMKLCSNLASLDRAVMSRAQKLLANTHAHTQKNTQLNNITLLHLVFVLSM